MLRLQHISKSFSGVPALQDISLQCNGGEIHALCGENGAGKSTLMHIIAGNLLPDSGTIFWNGTAQLFQNRMQSQACGISIVYQERSLVESLTIAENIFPNHAPQTSWGLIDYAALQQQAQQLLDTLGLQHLSAKTIVSRLSPAQKSLVEIAKALAQQPSLLILDEPTASLTHQETAQLFQILLQLKAKGVALIYITHRMAEIEQLADVVSVLKDGRYQGTVDAKTTSPDHVIRMMVGRELEQWQYQSNLQPEILLDVKNLSGAGFTNISFAVKRGEIFGLAGLPGSGRTALARTLFGDATPTSGTIVKSGKPVLFSHPADAVKQGIAYLPDDRKAWGLFLDASIAENIAATHLQSGWYNERKTAATAEVLRTQLAIRTPSIKQAVRKLSGGNQQKVVLAKWLRTDPDLLIVNEPTHGVDVGAKRQLYELLKKFTAAGKSVILISGELPELLLLSDRIGVLYQGVLRTVLHRAEATEERLTTLASGL